ncbi:unnamed protein product [Ceratitis capitata]|uniref:(Mediterranean fruit fly) hypothetical protein n=1 Tax=Ceratitis capitata TaxID=7213 RepID=A0A811UUE9_CERCA|nr:unnamed protein product [Ceratitis capitata]
MRQQDFSGRLGKWSMKLQIYKLKFFAEKELKIHNIDDICELELQTIIDLDYPDFVSVEYKKLR